jgi:hypothetical protein
MNTTEPIRQPRFAVVSVTERYTGPSDWAMGDLARSVADRHEVTLVACVLERRWFGARQRAEITVRGRGDAVAAFWRDLDESVGPKRGFSLGDLLGP